MKTRRKTWGHELAEYYRDVARLPPLTKEQEARIGRRILDGSPKMRAKCRELLARHNLRLVFKLAKRFLCRGLSLSDLVQEGSLGLLKAASTFDPARGCRFSTHACCWVKMALGRGVENHGRLVRVPGYQRRLWRLYEHAERRLALATGERPDQAAVLAEVCDTETYKAYHLGNPQTVLAGVVSFRAAVSQLGGLDYLDGHQPADPASVPGAVAFRERLTEALEALEALPEREALVLRLRYGLAGDEGPLTQQEVGDRWGISRERVRQLEMQALRRARGDAGGAGDGRSRTGAAPEPAHQLTFFGGQHGNEDCGEVETQASPAGPVPAQTAGPEPSRVC